MTPGCDYLIQRGRSIFDIKFGNGRGGILGDWAVKNDQTEKDYSKIFYETIGKSCGKEVKTKVLKQVSYSEVTKNI